MEVWRVGTLAAESDTGILKVLAEFVNQQTVELRN